MSYKWLSPYLQIYNLPSCLTLRKIDTLLGPNKTKKSNSYAGLCCPFQVEAVSKIPQYEGEKVSILVS